MENEWNYNVKDAPKWGKVWLSIERDDGKVYVVLDRASLWRGDAYAWKPYEMPKPAPFSGAKPSEQRFKEWYGL